MSRIKILEPIEIIRFSTPPTFNDTKRKHFFGVSSEFWTQVPEFRKEISKVGFLLQWGYFKHSGYFYSVHDFVKADVDFVAKHLGMDAKLISMKTYSLHLALEHQQIILELMGYKSFNSSVADFVKQVEYLIEIPLMPRKVLYESVQWLTKNKIEKPSYNKFRRIISTAYNHYNFLNNKKLDGLISPDLKIYLDEMFDVDIDTKQMLFNAFKKPSQSLSPGKIKESLVYFRQLKEYFQTIEPVMNALNFNDAAINYYAYRTLKMKNHHTKTGKERYLYLLCFVTHQFRVWQDTFVEIILQSVTNSVNQTKRIQLSLSFQGQGKRKAATKILIKNRNNYKKQILEAIRILEDPKELNEEKIANALFILKKEDVLTAAQQELIDGLDNDVNKDETEEFLEYFSRQYRRANQRIGGILKELSFDRDNSDIGLLLAIDDFVKTKGQIKDIGQNTSWLSSTETESLIDQEGNFDKNLYRMLLFRAVANAIKNGTLVLKESYQFRPFEHYLLDKAYFKANRVKLLQECGLGKLVDFKEVIRILKKELDEQYHKTNQRFLSGENTDLIIDEDGEKKIDTPLRTRPDNFKSLDTFFEKAGYINIIDLLSEVEKNTFFLSEIEHLGGKHAKGRPSHETFFAGRGSHYK